MEKILNGNIIENQVGGYADVLFVEKAIKAQPIAAQVEELEFATA